MIVRDNYALRRYRKEAVMSNNLFVAPYTPEQRETCAGLFQKVYNMPPFAFAWLDGEKAKSYFWDLESIPNSLSFILMDGSMAVGACMGQKEEHFQNPGYKINEFFIEPEHQHLGLGAYFINELENKLHELGVKTMYLFTQRNMYSFDFYLKNNFIVNDGTVHMAKVIRQEPTVVYTRTFVNSED